MKTIIVPLDGSDFAEQAVRPGRALAARTGADVVLMTSCIAGVVVEPEAYLTEAAARGGIADARRVVIADHGVVGALQTMCGVAADPVVCMTTHGRSGVGQALLGSVAEEVIRRVEVPLLLVGPSVDAKRATRFESVVVCTDGSYVSQSIAPVVSDWIRRLRLRSWVVQVLDPEVRGELEQAPETVVEANAVYALAQWLMHQDGAGVNWDVLHGENVSDAIVDYASALPASLIAMATHGRSGLARFALGSVAASVVHAARCPVLVARPDGLHDE